MKALIIKYSSVVAKVVAEQFSKTYKSKVYVQNLSKDYDM